MIQFANINKNKILNKVEEMFFVVQKVYWAKKVKKIYNKIWFSRDCEYIINLLKTIKDEDIKTVTIENKGIKNNIIKGKRVAGKTTMDVMVEVIDIVKGIINDIIEQDKIGAIWAFI